MIGMKELLVIMVVVLLVFGTKKLRNLGGDLGSTIKDFKKAMSEGEDAAGKEKVVHDPASDKSDHKS